MPMETNRIYNESNINTIRRMPDEFVDLVVTSPPYDNLRAYKGYQFEFEALAAGLYRVAKDGGVVVWIVNDATVNGSETGTSFQQALFFKSLGFNLHDTMFYEKAGSLVCGSLYAYRQQVEYMFVFSKGKPKTINLIADKRNLVAGKVGTRTGTRQVDGTHRTKDAGVVNDFSVRSNIWRYQPGNNGDDYTGHPAVFPEQLAKDHIRSWSNEGDLVYDPFMGSGTTAKAAYLLNRRWIGSEISSEYVELANKRLEPYLMQPSLI
jgi:DNA modification methylase